MSQSTVSGRSKSPAKSHSSSNVAEIMPPNDIHSLTTPQAKRKQSSISLMEDQDHSTIPDPRIQPRSPANGNHPSSPDHHPDLDQEVAALSTKLINAINHQTTLDDTLSVTRQELEASRERVRELEDLVARQQETLAGDVWIRRKSAEAEKAKLLARIVEEKRLRVEVEKDKRKIEQELETLTVSLFEEANKMVITAKEDAKKNQEALQRKNEQLKAQMADTESLLKSQQEQLAELKLVMEQFTAERDDHSGTVPSSPGFSRFDADDIQVSESASQAGGVDSVPPTYPTNLQHLVQPILRTDLSSFDDFVALIMTSKRLSNSRASSGSYSGLNPILSFGGSGGHASAPSNASTASLSTLGTPGSNVSPQTPNTPASTISAGSSAPLPPLKETKFYKRVLAEDVEPTLRLDTAPGLSWLARRSVLNAMTEGTLVVEPVPTNSPFASISKPQFYPCSLCGEIRRDASHLRNHRFRTSESESAQRYPLCKYCLDRVRSTCDFLGFLRMVKDGHWRADDADAERAAWEESVRLRDQMFWSRIGGGVVPVHGHHLHPGSVGGEKSARTSQDANRASADGNKTNEAAEPSAESKESTVMPEPDETQKEQEEAQQPEETVIAVYDEKATPEVIQLRPTPNARDSTHSTLSTISAHTLKDRGQRLSLSIPGAFEEESSAA
ncbi:hypothetical protein F5B20DRAFT_161711 [Whalleya microplaca]|nr:hypothetical protein F5B20DRAFT_161711 [Whalleya microplaca]